jgi:hypothetical protein
VTAIETSTSHHIIYDTFFKNILLVAEHVVAVEAEAVLWRMRLTHCNNGFVFLLCHSAVLHLYHKIVFSFVNFFMLVYE